MKTHLMRMTAFALALLFAGTCFADALKVKGLPKIENVLVIGVENGKLKYRANSRNGLADLGDVEFLEVKTDPKFAAGVKSFNDGKMRAAMGDLEEVWEKGRQQWLRHFAGYYLTQLHDKRDNPAEAGKVYIKLAAEKADPFFLNKPPVASLAKADKTTKEQIAQGIDAVLKDAKGDHLKLLAYYREKVTGEKSKIEIKKPDTKSAAGGAVKAKSKVIMPAQVWKMLDKKGESKEKWQGLVHLANGENEKAIELQKKWLNNPLDTPEKLFILGRAQLALADAKKTDKKLYLDAALTFMRIVVHFTRETRTDPLVAPAKLEVAYIHKQIGRDDIYEKLLEEAQVDVEDKQAYPEYHKRYYQIIGEKIPADEEE